MSVIKTRYGKRAIKAARVSPDAWAQLLVQPECARLLHARGWKPHGVTYESATMGQFFKGRTKVVYVVTCKSNVFVRAMIEGVGKDKEEADVENMKKLFELLRRTSRMRRLQDVERSLHWVFYNINQFSRLNTAI